MKFGEKVSHTFLLGENREVPLVNNSQVEKKKKNGGCPDNKGANVGRFHRKMSKV